MVQTPTVVLGIGLSVAITPPAIKMLWGWCEKSWHVQELPGLPEAFHMFRFAWGVANTAQQLLVVPNVPLQRRDIHISNKNGLTAF